MPLGSRRLALAQGLLFVVGMRRLCASLLALTACATPTGTDEDAPDKEQLATELGDGKADASIDWCERWGWYEDGEFARLFDSSPAYPKTESAMIKWMDAVERDNNAYALAIRFLYNDEIIGYDERGLPR